MYESPFIKDVKRESRGYEDTEKYFIFGPRQRIPSDFNELLKISSFKRQLLRFWYVEYEAPVYGAILGRKVFYCATDNECKKYYSEDGLLMYELTPIDYGWKLLRGSNLLTDKWFEGQ